MQISYLPCHKVKRVIFLQHSWLFAPTGLLPCPQLYKRNFGWEGIYKISPNSLARFSRLYVLQHLSIFPIISHVTYIQTTLDYLFPILCTSIFLCISSCFSLILQCFYSPFPACGKTILSFRLSSNAMSF